MNDDKVVIPKKVNAFTLTFDKNGQVSGTTDCNNFSGSYEVKADGSITFGPFMSTLMFCESSEEDIFLKYITESNKIFFDDSGNLVLLLPYDSGSVIFKKQ
ncbi:MAG: hypothetical protein QG654_151 [Patescibacteria group bacterium]|nr:hypothetical protein [Patescibacteria group bacterium]